MDFTSVARGANKPSCTQELPGKLDRSYPGQLHGVAGCTGPALVCPWSEEPDQINIKLDRSYPGQRHGPTSCTGPDTENMNDGQEPASCTAPSSLGPGRRQGPTSCTVPDTLDFPAINEEYRGRPYCFVWGWTARNYSRIVLVKKNLCTGLLKLSCSMS